jgi:calcium-dependent protein kinase
VFTGGEMDFDIIMKAIDLDNNGKISYSEFVTAAADINKMLTEQNLRQAFNLFDIDNNGQITPRELKYVLANKN